MNASSVGMNSVSRSRAGGGRLTLASQSPRRAKILAAHGVAFEIEKTSAPEIAWPAEPERTVTENALRKLRACGRRPALAADTIVWRDGRIYGKPADEEEAKRFLRGFSGVTHTVFTGVAYDDGSGERTACERSEVTFRTLSEADIEAYVTCVRPLDRAGAYDIDTRGECLVARYTGSYENIMGLPLAPLRAFGILPD